MSSPHRVNFELPLYFNAHIAERLQGKSNIWRHASCVFNKYTYDKQYFSLTIGNNYYIIKKITFIGSKFGRKKNRIDFYTSDLSSNKEYIKSLSIDNKNIYNYIKKTVNNEIDNKQQSSVGGSKKKTKSPKIHIGPRGGKYIKKKGKKIYIK